jgi:hypothetical protein
MYISLATSFLGVVFIIARKKIALAMFSVQRAGLKFVFGKFIDIDDLSIPKYYSWGVLFAGVILIIFAYAWYFGPISL